MGRIILSLILQVPADLIHQGVLLLVGIAVCQQPPWLADDENVIVFIGDRELPFRSVLSRIPGQFLQPVFVHIKTEHIALFQDCVLFGAFAVDFEVFAYDFINS